MIVATVLYKNGVNFDSNYYENTHQPFFVEKLTPIGLKKFEILKVLASAEGSASPYQVIALLYFDSMEAFQSAMQHPDTGLVIGDIQHFYQEAPEILVAETFR